MKNPPMGIFQTLLALVDDLRTIDWAREYPFASVDLREIQVLIS